MDRDRSGQTRRSFRNGIAFKRDKPTTMTRIELIGARTPGDCEGREARARRQAFGTILAERRFGGDARQSEIVIPALRQGI